MVRAARQVIREAGEEGNLHALRLYECVRGSPAFFCSFRLPQKNDDGRAGQVERRARTREKFVRMRERELTMGFCHFFFQVKGGVWLIFALFGLDKLAHVYTRV